MAANVTASANDKLIKNLESQLDRLVDQLKDLEECKNELAPDEYESMKDDTVDQIKEFTVTLERINKGDITLNNTFSTMRAAIRNAISSSFNTVEMIKLFGDQNTSDLEKQLLDLEECFKLKKIPIEEYESRKVNILTELSESGHSLSVVDETFLDNNTRSGQYLANMEQVNDDG